MAADFLRLHVENSEEGMEFVVTFLTQFCCMPKLFFRGGTCSKLVVVDDDGNVLLSRTFGGLNYHIVGLENAVDRVATVILEALAETCGVRKLTGLVRYDSRNYL